MEQLNQTITGMLDLMSRPAFAVNSGMILYANKAAQSCGISQGTTVEQLLETGSEEYAALGNGCLYLTVRSGDRVLGASVTRMEGFDLFLPDREEDIEHLQILALAARELRGPLADVMIAASQLQKDGSADPCTEQETQLNQGLHRILRLIGNMSDAYRYRADPPLRQELRDMPAVISEICEKASALAAQGDIILRFENRVGSVIGMVDQEKLERAVYNILSNAMKFTPSGSTVEARLTHRGDKLFFTVCNSGTRIPGDILRDIYTRHLRQPDFEDKRYGLGLGMLMIRTGAAAHGGTVMIEHNCETDTRLTMTLAVRQQQEGDFRSTRLKVDYAGHMDHGMIELADVLPSKLYEDVY